MKSGSAGPFDRRSSEVHLLLLIARGPDILWAQTEKICNNALDLWIRCLHRIREGCSAGITMVAGKLSHSCAFFDDGSPDVSRVPVMLLMGSIVVAHFFAPDM